MPMLISHIELYLIYLHCPPIIERDNPLKFLQISILEGGKGFMRLGISQISVGNKELDFLGFVGGMSKQPCPPPNLEGLLLRELFFSNHRACSNIIQPPSSTLSDLQIRKFSSLDMLISHVKPVYIIDSHRPRIIERDVPLKSFNPQFLRVGRGLEDCLSLNNGEH